MSNSSNLSLTDKSNEAQKVIPNSFRVSKVHKDQSSDHSSKDDSVICKCIFDNTTNTISNQTLELKNSNKACSKMCRYLSPLEQKNIIFKNIEIYEDLSENYNDETKYIIPSQWWEKWCQFINVENKSYEELVDKYSFKRKS